jgi:hypothetical protein
MIATPEQLRPVVRELAQLFVQAVRDELASLAPNTKPDVLTPLQVAREIKRSPATVRSWCKSGLLGRDMRQPGSNSPQWSITRSELNEFLKSTPAPQRPTKRTRRKAEPDVIEFFS